MTSDGKVYIILVNWNGHKDTIECLESIFLLNYEPFQVIVCDNGSADDSILRIEQWADTRLPELKAFYSGVQNPLKGKSPNYVVLSREDAERGLIPPHDPPLIIVDCRENLGFAGGNNVGLQYAIARCDFSYAWLLNNDTVVDSHALAKLVERMKDKPDAGMCGSTLLLYDRPEKVQALGGGYYCKWIGLPWHIGRLKTVRDSFSRERSERWMNYVIGASLLVSKDFIEAVGLMEEEYFLYFEELDWALRARGRFSLAYSPESIVYHKVGGTIGTTSNPATKSYICDFFNVRNRILFTRKYFPCALPSIYISLIGAMLLRALFWKWGRVLMIWKVITGGQLPSSSREMPV